MSLRVLVVDDHFLNVKLLEARMQLASHVALTAMSGAEALDTLTRFRPDVVLLDVMMPGMDGYEVCRRIRANPDTATLPVIMVTALDKESDRQAGLAAGANEFLNKPVGDDVLFPVIERVIAEARAAGASNPAAA